MRHSAPRPFSQMMRRSWWLRLPLPRGYAAALNGPQSYRRRRRRNKARIYGGAEQ